VSVRLDGLRHVYGGGRRPEVEALGPLDLEIGNGEFVAIVGPSGCGKSTLLSLLAGFQRPTAGAVTVDGRPVLEPGPERGVVFQHPNLYPWLDVRDNVAFGLRMRGVGRRERHQAARQYLELVGLRGQDRKYPSELSGGMKQRIQIARVLANDPKVLLMDEPFGALDAQTRAELQDEVVRIWMETHKTILFITHDIGEAILLGDRIGVMRHGPGSNIREIIPVTLPRPRTRATLEFGQLYERINRLIIEEVKLGREAVHVGS
jgi:NitT/TauT family transport system ATP-binding protein